MTLTLELPEYYKIKFLLDKKLDENKPYPVHGYVHRHGPEGKRLSKHLFKKKRNRRGR